MMIAQHELWNKCYYANLKCAKDLCCTFKVMNTIQASESPLLWSSHCGSAVTNLTNIHEDASSISGLTQCVKDLALL